MNLLFWFCFLSELVWVWAIETGTFIYFVSRAKQVFDSTFHTGSVPKKVTLGVRTQTFGLMFVASVDWWSDCDWQLAILQQPVEIRVRRTHKQHFYKSTIQCNTIDRMRAPLWEPLSLPDTH